MRSLKCPSKAQWENPISLFLCLAFCGPASRFVLHQYHDRTCLGGIRGGNVGRGLLFVSSLLYLQPQAVVLFLLWIGWWARIFPFMLFQYTQLSVNKSYALCVCLCVCAHVGMAMVNIYEQNSYFSARNVSVDSGACMSICLKDKFLKKFNKSGRL